MGTHSREARIRRLTEIYRDTVLVGQIDVEGHVAPRTTVAPTPKPRKPPRRVQRPSLAERTDAVQTEIGSDLLDILRRT